MSVCLVEGIPFTIAQPQWMFKCDPAPFICVSTPYYIKTSLKHHIVPSVNKSVVSLRDKICPSLFIYL